ncbi:hypothetical protein TorRG33x02_197200 [Trema orientale]|uniref:Uncharacterized protein n=1 Tax=Trema orientale TaxID=63057 RepID=A0A2P5EG52_TREOI|nr:hypothetical protein TorRG33x02_197200 [Trema orientale]
MRNDITSFVQYDLESLYEEWEQYKGLLRRFPHHGIPKLLQVQTFYNSLESSTRTTIHIAAGEVLMGKSIDEAYNLPEEMAFNNYKWPSERMLPMKTIVAHEVDAITALSVQIGTSSKKFDTMGVHAIQSSFVVCEICNGNHTKDGYPSNMESMQYVVNYNWQQNNLHSNFYNLGWKNHPNFLWSNNNQRPSSSLNNRPMYPPGFPSQPPIQEKKPFLEDLFAQYMSKNGTIL